MPEVLITVLLVIAAEFVAHRKAVAGVPHTRTQRIKQTNTLRLVYMTLLVKRERIFFTDKESASLLYIIRGAVADHT
jgi:hypothetical protein